MAEPAADLSLVREKYLSRLRRIDAINAQKHAYASSLVSPQSLRFLAVLPVLLHYNVPGLPGYRPGSIPCGIDFYTPTAAQLQAVQEWCGQLPPEPEQKRILGLYGMGSTASAGQGANSDFDIWVCVSHSLTHEQLLALNEKCQFICTYARGLGVDLNLFVTRDDRFTNAAADQIGGDNCGSAQNLFLLDEFYRSAVRLAGRYLTWYFISSDEELDDYAGYAAEFADSGALPENGFFDFGSVVGSSPAEYFGSGLWLLYKGIEQPFKAALKILLMETYADDYPQTQLLSSQMKDELLNGSGVYDLRLDPYFLMYRKVHDYLIKEGDFGRLHLVRKCFYLKIFLGLKGLPAGPIVTARRRLLDELAESWRWSADERAELENRGLWKIHYIGAFYQALYASLMQSYRALLSFSVRHGIEYAITSDDAGVLSRKLYAAYDPSPGKVILYSPEFTYSLEEPDLTFVKAGAQSLCPQGWHVYAARGDSIEILETRRAYAAGSITEAVTWACLNRLLTKRTQIFAAGAKHGVTADKIRRLADDIMRLISREAHAKVPDSALMRPRELKTCAVLLNLERDLTAQSRLQGYELTSGTTLSAGRQHVCLIGSVTLLTVNSWGETLTVELPDGEEGVIELLAVLLRVSKNAEQVDLRSVLSSIQVCCYAAAHADLIRYDMQALIRQVFSCLTSPEDGAGFAFTVGHNNYAARSMRDRGVYIVRHNVLGDEINTFGVYTRFGMRPEYALQVPAQVDRYANVGIMQYFFAPLVDGWDIYIVNEDNEVQIYPHYVGSRAALVNAINRYYTKLSEENQVGRARFNLPQYFVLSADLKSIHPFTIREQARID